jgi:hypothetical protein
MNERITDDTNSKFVRRLLLVLVNFTGTSKTVRNKGREHFIFLFGALKECDTVCSSIKF